MRVDEFGSGDVLRVLRPIWNVKRETAQRVRQRISAVMKAAIADGHRLDNPAGDALTRRCRSGPATPEGGASVPGRIPHTCRECDRQRLRLASAGATRPQLEYALIEMIERYLLDDDG